MDDWVRLDLSVVRGLAYYTGIVFELFDTAGEFRAICGGGRYDDLLATLGRDSGPALGFGMGDVVLGELLRSRKLMPALEPATTTGSAADEDALLRDVMTVAARLRGGGPSVEYALRPQQLSRQLKAATAREPPNVVILLRDQWNGGAGTMTVKDAADGSERVVRWLTSSQLTGVSTMADDKKLTPRAEDFSAWYNETGPSRRSWRTTRRCAAAW